MHTIGIDIGGTKIAGGLVDDFGAITTRLRADTDPERPLAIVDAVIDMVRELRGDREIAAVGVAAAGFMDAARTTIYYAPNIAWKDFELRDRLEAALGLPVVIENDANAAGWAEFRFGAGQLSSNMTMITIGTGVGGAIIVDDRLVRGGFGFGGEIGHMRFVPDGLPCGCGARGCIEQYASGRSLQRYAAEVATSGERDAERLRARLTHKGTIRGTDIKELLDAGDPGALRALDRLGTALGQACASFDAILDPDMFVIGGGVSQAGERLLAPVREAFDAVVPARGYRPVPEFAIAQLVNDAGVIGVADLARLEMKHRG